MLEYESMKSCISTVTRNLPATTQTRDINTDINHELHVGDNKIKNYYKLETGKIYNLIVEKVAEQASAYNKWVDQYQIENDRWKQANIGYYNLVENVKIQNVQFKINHRIINCAQKLKEWKINSTATCKHDDGLDTLEHYFITCTKCKHLWVRVEEWLLTNLKVLIHCNTIDLLLGIVNENKEPMIDIRNWVNLHVKHHIYTQNNKGDDFCFAKLLKTMEMSIEGKFFAARLNKKEEECEFKWGPLKWALKQG